MREVVHLTTLGLLGTGLPLTSLPVRKDLCGLGMSDAGGYTALLEERLDYVNTWYDREPRLDITAVPEALAERHDLVISSDVLEHVLAPVQRAFDGLARLLRPGGVLVLTVPSVPGASTVEHYPDAVDYAVSTEDGSTVVDLTRLDGSVHRAADPVFHGGSGATLEMRVFGLDAVLDHLRAAGFSGYRVLRDDVPRFGIVRRDEFSHSVLAYR
jgi:SAM-dependent methyltransferase